MRETIVAIHLKNLQPSAVVIPKPLNTITSGDVYEHVTTNVFLEPNPRIFIRNVMLSDGGDVIPHLEALKGSKQPLYFTDLEFKEFDIINVDIVYDIDQSCTSKMENLRLD